MKFLLRRIIFIALFNLSLSQNNTKMKENEDNSKLDLKKYETEYSEQGLSDKLSQTAKKAGLKVVYYVLLLYYALQSPKISVKEKTLIIGALGYFILPLDLVPDVIAGAGFLDDAAALLAVIKMLTCIDDDIKSRAKEQLAKWFDGYDEKQLND